MSGELKYAGLSDEEVEQLIIQRLRDIRKLLEEIREILKRASAYE